MTTQSTTTKEALEPCPKCNDCWALQVQEQEPPLLAKTVVCGRCGFRAPFDTWQARVSAPIVAPVVDDETKHDYAAGFLRAIAEGLRHAIRDHGPITSEWIGSASKRVYSRLKGTKYVK